jgi:SAM-dependent methyltransferase
VAAFLAERGLEVVGVDVSEAMLAAARDVHPSIPFRAGQLDRLPFDDAVLGGAVCWYSIIYTPPEHLDAVFSELRRVLVGRSHALFAFQGGAGEAVVRANAHGTSFSLTSVRHDVEHVARRLQAAGFGVRATVVREPEFDHESTRQAFVLARAE